MEWKEKNPNKAPRKETEANICWRGCGMPC